MRGIFATDISPRIQIHQNIASFFENDSDVYTYAQLSKQTRDSISSSVWRKRFTETFDMPDGDFDTLALAKKYAYRRDVAGWICFNLKQYGAVSRECKAVQEKNTKKCLIVLRDLILGESYQTRVGDLKRSTNASRKQSPTLAKPLTLKEIKSLLG
jgi:hypothetical protein